MSIGAIWADIWDEAIWDTSIWSQVVVQPEPETPKKAGGGRYKRIRYVVEVDGQFLQVSNISEVESILGRAKELAHVAAPKDVKPGIRIKPPRIAVRTGEGKPVTSKVLQRAVADTQGAVNEIYRKAARQLEITREIAGLIHEKLRTEAQEDEDEAVLALLL